MAEEFVIRVQVEQLQGRSAAPRTGSGSEQNTGSGFSNPLMAQLEQTQFHNGPFARELRRGTYFGARDPNETKSQMEAAKVQNISQQVLKRHFFTNDIRTSGTLQTGMGAIGVSQDENVMNGLGMAIDSTAGFLHQHRARVRSTLTIAANSAIRAGIAIKNHRSGDSYRNEQRQLTASAGSQLASIGIAGAVWGGTAAIAFAISAGVGAATNAIIENANFKYDRMMDTHYIHNTKQVAGDISYGRNRRGGN